MKNITKYILAAAAAFSSLTACQEFEDFDKTIDGTPGLVYVQTGTENLYTIPVSYTHLPPVCRIVKITRPHETAGLT